MSKLESKLLKDKAKPRGTFLHMKRAGDLLFVSGTRSRRTDNNFIGVETDEMDITSLDIKAQTHAVIKNIRDILRQCRSGLEDIVEISSFLVNMNDFSGYNEIYSEFFNYGGPT